MIPGTFCRGTDGCILMFDLTKPETFEHINFWKEEFLKLIDLPNADGFPIIVIGNKNDLEEKKVSGAEIWCKNNGMPYFEISTKDSTNLDTAMHNLLTMALGSTESYEEYVKIFLLSSCCY